MAADRQHRDVRLMHARDERHVAEHACVAGEIDAQAVFHRQHEAAGRTRIAAIRRAAGMARLRHRDRNAGHLDSAADIRPIARVVRQALPLQPVPDILRRDDEGRELSPDVHGLADMVEMAVRKDDEIGGLRRPLARRTIGILQPRVNIDAHPAWRGQTEMHCYQAMSATSTCDLLLYPAAASLSRFHRINRLPAGQLPVETNARDGQAQTRGVHLVTSRTESR